MFVNRPQHNLSYCNVHILHFHTHCCKCLTPSSLCFPSQANESLLCKTAALSAFYFICPWAVPQRKPVPWDAIAQRHRTRRASERSIQRKAQLAAEMIKKENLEAAKRVADEVEAEQVPSTFDSSLLIVLESSNHNFYHYSQA